MVTFITAVHASIDSREELFRGDDRIDAVRESSEGDKILFRREMRTDASVNFVFPVPLGISVNVIAIHRIPPYRFSYKILYNQ